MPAFRVRIAEAGPATCLEGDIVLEVALAGGPAADRAGAGGVPDLGQVPEPGAGVVAAGLEAVVAVLGGEGMEFDEELPAVDAEGPGPEAAGRPVAAGAGEAEGGLRSVPVAGGSRGPGAGVPGGVPVVVGGGSARDAVPCLSAGPFPLAARRTGRAALTASGSPRVRAWAWLCGGCLHGPGGRDRVSPVAVARDLDL